MCHLICDAPVTVLQASTWVKISVKVIKNPKNRNDDSNFYTKFHLKYDLGVQLIAYF